MEPVRASERWLSGCVRGGRGSEAAGNGTPPVHSLCLLPSRGRCHPFLPKSDFSSTVMKRVQYRGIHTFSSRTFSSPQEGARVSTEPSNLSFSQRDTSPPLSVIDTALLGWGCNLSAFLDDSHQDASASHLPRSSFHCGHPCLGLRCCPQLLPLWWAPTPQSEVAVWGHPAVLGSTA